MYLRTRVAKHSSIATEIVSERVLIEITVQFPDYHFPPFPGFYLLIEIRTSLCHLYLFSCNFDIFLLLRNLDSCRESSVSIVMFLMKSFCFIDLGYWNSGSFFWLVGTASKVGETEEESSNWGFLFLLLIVGLKGLRKTHSMGVFSFLLLVLLFLCIIVFGLVCSWRYDDLMVQFCLIP